MRVSHQILHSSSTLARSCIQGRGAGLPRHCCLGSRDGALRVHAPTSAALPPLGGRGCRMAPRSAASACRPASVGAGATRLPRLSRRGQDGQHASQVPGRRARLPQQAKPATQAPRAALPAGRRPTGSALARGARLAACACAGGVASGNSFPDTLRSLPSSRNFQRWPLPAAAPGAPAPPYAPPPPVPPPPPLLPPPPSNPALLAAPPPPPPLWA